MYMHCFVPFCQILPLLVAALASWASATGVGVNGARRLHHCKGPYTSKPMKVATCEIEISEWACLEHWHLKYEGQAKELTSGVASPKVTWFDSKTGAAEMAIYKLVNCGLVHTTPDSKDYCNCYHKDIPVNAGCTLRGTLCAMFNNTNDVKLGKISYHAWATNLVTGHVGEVLNQGNVTTAAENAIIALAEKYPADAATCAGQPPPSPAPAPTPAPGPLFVPHCGTGPSPKPSPKPTCAAYGQYCDTTPCCAGCNCVKDGSGPTDTHRVCVLPKSERGPGLRPRTFVGLGNPKCGDTLPPTPAPKCEEYGQYCDTTPCCAGCTCVKDGSGPTDTHRVCVLPKSESEPKVPKLGLRAGAPAYPVCSDGAGPMPGSAPSPSPPPAVTWRDSLPPKLFEWGSPAWDP